ncbi:6-phosphogluconolactonase [Actinospica sp. MGRD01-02]|uniref:6-phosphogluconolactonase n=1 Tax=Actinospica acidithermotolerans TaxID=2828514 RepID=A0A941E799_9ACTN|nr:6-phosphogluconolactonase [Actinospica acidithermotolerans]MBR7825243.1 6-phosphogluconolactonase [Actinospica acidithermotolerans]
MTAARAGARVIRHPSGPVLASAAAARLATKLVDVLAERDVAHLVLTGGTIGIGTLAALAQLPAREAVDWGRVHLWWGDERFVPAGDKERNETQAREALLDGLPLNPEFVHVMAPSDGPDGDDAAAAAERYAAELAKYAGSDGKDAPEFDVLLLGMGPDGHIASLFPDHPGTREVAPSVIAVHNSPKPPPDRISLTFRVIQAAREVWVVASGAEKAEAVARALSSADQVHTPAVGAHGTEATLWLVDEAAAGLLR